MRIERFESSVRKSPRCTESHVTLSISRDLQKRRKKRVGRVREKEKKKKSERYEKREGSGTIERKES